MERQAVRAEIDGSRQMAPASRHPKIYCEAIPDPDAAATRAAASSLGHIETCDSINSDDTTITIYKYLIKMTKILTNVVFYDATALTLQSCRSIAI